MEKKNKVKFTTRSSRRSRRAQRRMRNFTLVTEMKLTDSHWGKGVLRSWRHKDNDRMVLTELCFPNHHLWKDTEDTRFGGVANMAYWINQYGKKAKDPHKCKRCV